MSILFGKLVLLGSLMLIGWIFGRRVKVDIQGLGTLLIYVIAPVVFFSGAYRIPLSLSNMSLPVFFYGASTLICFSVYSFSRQTIKSSDRNILAYMAGTANTGYFGIPAALALFGDEIYGYAVVSSIGVTIFEATIGFYISARGKFTRKESFTKLLRLPVLYAFFAGILFNAFQVNLFAGVEELILHFRGAYVVLGMMMVGFGLSRVERLLIERKFLSWALGPRLILWPALMGVVVWLDQFVHFFDQNAHRMIILMGFFPLAANSVVFASVFGLSPEKVSFSVVLSHLISFLLIPLAFAILSF